MQTETIILGYEKSIGYARVAQFGRAVPSYGKGHRFKSCLWYYCATHRNILVGMQVVKVGRL